ncbi:MAG: LacI family DNA-binding transcriptional regulator [Armatimonadota bacterium]
MRTLSKRQAAPHAVTLQDIAAQCGVHKMTVSRALRGEPNIRPEKLQRILAAAAALGYDPARHHAARRLAMQKHGQKMVNQVLALVFPALFPHNPYFSRILDGIIEVLTPRGYALLTICTLEQEGRGKKYKLPSIFHRGDVDGIITFGHPASLQELVRQLRAVPGAERFPVVNLMQPLAGCSAVLADDRAGAYAAACHLLDLGHRTIVHYAGGDHDFHSRERMAAYRQAFRERGLEPDTYLIECESDRTLPDEIRHSRPFLQLLARYPEATAVLARNDYGAVQIWRALMQEGRELPCDFSVVGFDDAFPIYDVNQQNRLTTVHIPLEGVGQEAARLMLRLVEGGPEQGNERIVLPAELIVRGSTTKLM